VQALMKHEAMLYTGAEDVHSLGIVFFELLTQEVAQFHHSVAVNKGNEVGNLGAGTSAAEEIWRWWAAYQLNSCLPSNVPVVSCSRITGCCADWLTLVA
jgi:hypothetical protein